MAIELTDEMRKAVRAEMCEQQGHLFSFNNVSSAEINEVRNPDEMRLPHLVCTRCNRVWIVVETPADDYDSAELGALNQLLPDVPYRVRIEELRRRRGVEGDAAS